MSEAGKKVYAPHQVRVVEEARQLGDKIAKLSAFIEDLSSGFDRLSVEERFRLRTQLQVMELYGAILLQRIENF